jgi:HK97 family phage major capsid protein
MDKETKAEETPSEEQEKQVSTAEDASIVPSEFDSLAKELKTLREAVEQAKTRVKDGKTASEDLEKQEKIQEEVTKLRAELDRVQNEKRISRKGQFDVDIQTTRFTPGQVKALQFVDAPSGSEIEELQNANDDLYMGMKLLGINNPFESKVLREHCQNTYPTYYKAMSTDSGAEQGFEWIPTGFSNQLVNLVRVELRVAALHDRFNMPTNPFVLPVEGADISAYVVSEATGDNDAVSTDTWVPADTPKTANRVFSAKKVGVRTVVSTEITEDSIIAILPYVRDKIAIALAEAQENVVINGHATTSGHIDNITSATNQATAWDGYRRTSGIAGTTSDIGGALDVNDLRSMRAKMKKYGINVNRLSWVVGINGYNAMLRNIPDVQTLDKFGPRATILTGQLAALDGIPIIVSEFIKEDLNSSGLLSGTGSKTETILVRRDTWRFGDRRPITLKSREVIETDQNVIVALQRLDFKGLFNAAQEPYVAVGVNQDLV